MFEHAFCFCQLSVDETSSAELEFVAVFGLLGREMYVCVYVSK
jgi:hypothetical protein